MTPSLFALRVHYFRMHSVNGENSSDKSLICVDLNLILLHTTYETKFQSKYNPAFSYFSGWIYYFNQDTHDGVHWLLVLGSNALQSNALLFGVTSLVTR